MATPVRNYTRGGGHAYNENLTREKWLQYILLDNKYLFNPQPPDWWLDARGREDISLKVATNIWYQYSPERKYVIWDQAPDKDFIARGYMK